MPMPGCGAYRKRRMKPAIPGPAIERSPPRFRRGAYSRRTRPCTIGHRPRRKPDGSSPAGQLAATERIIEIDRAMLRLLELGLASLLALAAGAVALDELRQGAQVIECCLLLTSL
jgi:hypothetical protein